MTLIKSSILIIDDDEDVLTALMLFLKGIVQAVQTERNPEKIPSLVKSGRFDLVLLDMNFNASVNTGNEGLYWLRKIKEIKPDLSVMLITAYGDIDLAVKSLKEGANDFIVKPWHNEKLRNSVLEILKARETKINKPEYTERESYFNGLLGRSESMRDIFTRIEKISPTDANILILGENGTGKDLIAGAIHEKSIRKDGPFIKVDVGALTETLFESELFGHKKGAFTDARDDRTGRIEAANGGTLFLDEIGNISLHQQAKLLSVLQNRQITPLGSNKPVMVDIRLICATNLPMSELANEQKFRKDLVYRINTVDIIVPPLRNRKEDIPVLSAHFLKMYADKYLKTELSLTAAAIEKLKNYRFPGNVRELQYAIERAVIMTDKDKIDDSDIIFSPIEYAQESLENEGETTLSSIEKKTILKVIEKNKGNISKAARELGITRTALYRRLGKYEI
ncbi:MAG TPA: sigma-54 dependent transcriptional regulator [Lentimicrobium sp.]|nr:sigma-54 dependent transcriptional regulator [Lentimicrobium sp.]